MKKLIETIKIIIVIFVQLSKGYIYNNFGEIEIPDYVVRDLARHFLPMILEMYSTEEGRNELEKWKQEMYMDGIEKASEAKSEGA